MRGIRSEGEDHVTENRALKQAIRERMEETGEKYTEARRAVLARAANPRPQAKMPLHIQEAERLGHNGIGCEHLLLGILADTDDVAAKLLTSHGLTLEAARRRTAELTGHGWRDSIRWTHSPRATVVGKLAEIEAERLGDVGVLNKLPSNAHMLLAMITEGAGVPNALFREFGVDVDKLRVDLLEALDVPRDLREAYLRQRTANEQGRRELAQN